MKLYQDPTLEHLDAKIIAWIIACVFIGLVLSAAFPADDRIVRNNRTNRVQMRGLRGGRAIARRKAA
jgi:ACR3 family arsenite efflux pump ArsB